MGSCFSYEQVVDNFLQQQVAILIFVVAIIPISNSWCMAVVFGGKNSIRTPGRVIPESWPPQLSKINSHGPDETFLTSPYHQCIQSRN